MTVVDDIKFQLDLVDIVSQNVKLRRTGKNYIGFCPFHSNTRTPSFVVFPETQTWRCFGQCNTGGDLFGYVMKREGWDFNETLKYLADKAGVTLHPVTTETEQAGRSREQLGAVLEQAVQFYRQQLVESDAGREALAYVRKRGLTDETIKTWGLGYAPAGWDELGKFFRHNGVSDSLLLEAGLLTQREDGETHDKFRHRLMFPIRDAYGKIAGFGGRVLDANDQPKYLNSPRTELFDKGRLLYGLDQARQPVRAAQQAVLVEGYMDVIGLHQAGFKTAVSGMGTALTEDQFRLLKKFTRNIVLALDPDAAGENATLRGLETARKSMDEEGEMSFDARGLLHVESRLRADIRVTTLPEGRDPDEIVLEDPEAWRKIMAEAKPVVVHVMETLMRGQDLSDAKVKRDIAARVLPLIEDVSDGVERESYRQMLAQRLRVDLRALESPVRSGGSSRRKRATTGRETLSAERLQSAAQRNRLLERHAIEFLVKDPEALFKLNRTLALQGLEQISEADFLEGDYKLVFGMVKASLEQNELSSEDFLAANLPDILEPSEEPEFIEKVIEPSTERVLQDQVRNILRIRRNLVEERIQQIQFLQSGETEEKIYTDEEAGFLVLEQLNSRRLIDLALLSNTAGGPGRKTHKSSIHSNSRNDHV